MNHIRRALAIAIIGVAAALLVDQRTAVAAASTDLCGSAGCSRGSRACAHSYGSVPHPECQEGVMCCPYPEESFFLRCYEEGAI